MKKLYFFLSPFFAIKYLLYRDIKRVVNKNSLELRKVLDIGCGCKPYKFIFKNAYSYEGIDFKSFSPNSAFVGDSPDYYFPNDYVEFFKLPFNDEFYDTVVSFQVLEHHPNPQAMVHEAARVIKKKGLIVFSFPFFWGLHEVPNDYFRFTYFGAKRLFEDADFEIEEIISQGGFFVLLVTLIGSFLFEYKPRILLGLLLVIFYVPHQILQLFSLVLDSLIPTKRFTLNYVVVCRKK